MTDSELAAHEENEAAGWPGPRLAAPVTRAGAHDLIRRTYASRRLRPTRHVRGPHNSCTPVLRQCA
jgi:hypothetical protein